ADNCAAEGGTLGSQSGGPPICVFVYSDMTIEAQGTLTVTGVGVVPIFVATGTVTIRGTLDVSAAGSRRGPGADPTNTRGRGGVGAQNSGSGGGGGGNGTSGGKGGIEQSQTAQEPGGVALGAPALSPIMAGGFGGGGGHPCIDVCPVGQADSGGGG